MLIKDMTDDELKVLIRQTVEETLKEFFAALDESPELKAEIKQRLIQLRKRREASIRDIPFPTFNLGIKMSISAEKKSMSEIKVFFDTNVLAITGFSAA